MSFTQQVLHSVINANTNKNVLFSSSRCYDNTAMPPPADIVKVAIEWPGANAQLIEMDQVSVCVILDIKHSYTHTPSLSAVIRFIKA